jgi:hypothetical protein
MKFYQEKWFCVLMLILFFPIGIFLMFKYKHFNNIVRIIITIIFGLMIVGYLGNNSPNNNSTSNNISNSNTTVEESQNSTSVEDKTSDSKQQEPEATWQEVISFEGNSIKDTQTFPISSDYWAIQWATKPGKYGDMNFQIYVYDENGNLKSVVANVIGEGSDTSYMRGKGNYYLSINTGQPYAIKILEYK